MQIKSVGNSFAREMRSTSLKCAPQPFRRNSFEVEPKYSSNPMWQSKIHHFIKLHRETWKFLLFTHQTTRKTRKFCISAMQVVIR